MSQVGFLTPGFDWRNLCAGFILDRRRIDVLRRHHTLARTHLRSEDLEALDVRFAVFSPGDLTSLSSEGRRGLQDPARFKHLFDAGASDGIRHVYRVLR
jgi:hypothetical protein